MQYGMWLGRGRLYLYVAQTGSILEGKEGWENAGVPCRRAVCLESAGCLTPTGTLLIKHGIWAGGATAGISLPGANLLHGCIGRYQLVTEVPRCKPDLTDAREGLCIGARVGLAYSDLNSANPSCKRPRVLVAVTLRPPFTPFSLTICPSHSVALVLTTSTYLFNVFRCPKPGLNKSGGD